MTFYEAMMREQQKKDIIKFVLKAVSSLGALVILLHFIVKYW